MDKQWEQESDQVGQQVETVDVFDESGLNDFLEDFSDSLSHFGVIEKCNQLSFLIDGDWTGRVNHLLQQFLDVVIVCRKTF